MMVPKNLSEAVRISISALEKIESDRRYVVDMKHWHLPTEDGCRVCLAGAVIAKLFDDPNRIYKKIGFGWDRVFSSLDAVRVGDLKSAEKIFYKKGSSRTALPTQTEISDSAYTVNRDKFKADLRNIANRLQEIGI